MLFQNSCVVPFGMTAMVSFLLLLFTVQPIRNTDKTDSNTILSIFFLDDWIAQASHTFDQTFHLVARFQKHRWVAREPSSGRRAGSYHAAGLERDVLGKKLDQPRHAKDQLIGV